MKPLILIALFIFPLTIGAQIYVPLKIVNGTATFESTVEVKGATAERIHKRTMDWIETNFLAAPVITLNTENRISANFFQDYSKDDWSDSFQHNLQIDITETGAVFTITDTGLGLVRDGDWKKHLTNMRVMFEQASNELFWSYSESLNKPAGK